MIKQFFPYCLLVIILMVSRSLPGQEINMLYTLGNTPQSNLLNPARYTDQSVVTVHLPLLSGLEFKLNNSFSVSDFVTIENKTATIDFGRLQSGIGAESYFTENLNLPLFQLQVRTPNNLFSGSISEKQLFRWYFDRNLVKLINEGNEAFIDNPFSTRFDFNFLHYREYALGYSRRINEKLSLGARIKLLTGFSAVDVKKMNIGLRTGSNLEYLTFSVEGDYNLSLPVNIEPGKESDTSLNTISYLTNFSNLGASFDFGISYFPIPELELSASIIDLGFINWKTNAINVTHGGSFIWKGFDLNSFIQQPESIEGQDVPDLNPLDALLDSVMQLIDFKFNNAPFSTSIPAKIFLCAEYSFHPVISVALVEQMMIYDRQFSNSLTLSANLKLGEIWSLSAGYSIIDRSFNNFSLGTSLKLGPVEFYAATSNILALNIQQTSNFSLIFGLNLMFGKLQPI